jgi:hypothetical protein
MPGLLYKTKLRRTKSMSKLSAEFTIHITDREINEEEGVLVKNSIKLVIGSNGMTFITADFDTISSLHSRFHDALQMAKRVRIETNSTNANFTLSLGRSYIQQEIGTPETSEKEVVEYYSEEFAEFLTV